MTCALIIGMGSIGERHARVLRGLGADVIAVSRRPSSGSLRTHTDISTALRDAKPDVAVIADETVRHRQTLGALRMSGFTGPVLVEKPVFDRPAAGDEQNAGPTFVGYNLRFHPLAQTLRRWLKGKRVITATLHVGQHLADWRTGRDHRVGYSANADAGGGVLRDLSHELDLALWLFGALHRVAAAGGNSGALGIKADDHHAILASLAQCPVAVISLNAFDRPARRSVHVATAEGTATLDFISGSLVAEGHDAIHVSLDRDHTFVEQHKAFLGGGTAPLCTYSEGLAALRFVDAAERAGRAGTWIEIS